MSKNNTNKTTLTSSDVQATQPPKPDSLTEQVKQKVSNVCNQVEESFSDAVAASGWGGNPQEGSERKEEDWRREETHPINEKTLVLRQQLQHLHESLKLRIPRFEDQVDKRSGERYVVYQVEVEYAGHEKKVLYLRYRAFNRFMKQLRKEGDLKHIETIFPRKHLLFFGQRLKEEDKEHRRRDLEKFMTEVIQEVNLSENSQRLVLNLLHIPTEVAATKQESDEEEYEEEEEKVAGIHEVDEEEDEEKECKQPEEHLLKDSFQSSKEFVQRAVSGTKEAAMGVKEAVVKAKDKATSNDSKEKELKEKELKEKELKEKGLKQEGLKPEGLKPEGLKEKELKEEELEEKELKK